MLGQIYSSGRPNSHCERPFEKTVKTMTFAAIRLLKLAESRTHPRALRRSLAEYRLCRTLQTQIGIRALTALKSIELDFQYSCNTLAACKVPQVRARLLGANLGARSSQLAAPLSKNAIQPLTPELK
jgi:hypothetical protein